MDEVMSDFVADGAAAVRRNERSCNEPNGRGDIVAQANAVPRRSVRARRCRVDAEQQQVELPLEHVGPEPTDVAQLCVAETSEIDQKPTGAFDQLSTK